VGQFFDFSKKHQFWVFQKIRIKELVGSWYLKNIRIKELPVLGNFKTLKELLVF
jgi:hypothetical protein